MSAAVALEHASASATIAPNMLRVIASSLLCTLVRADAGGLDRRPHFSISLATNVCRYSGVRRSGATSVTPSSCMRSLSAGVFIASTVASLSFLTMAAGVPLGRKKAFQVMASKLARPSSCAVARFGSSGSGCAPTTRCL